MLLPEHYSVWYGSVVVGNVKSVTASQEALLLVASWDYNSVSRVADPVLVNWRPQMLPALAKSLQSVLSLHKKGLATVVQASLV